MKRMVEITLTLAVIGGALAFGGVQTITYSILELVIFGLLFLVLFRQTRRGEVALPLPIWPVLFVGVVVLQLAPLPVSLVARVSPPRLADLSLFPQTTWAALSIYPRDTLLNLVKLLAYVSAFVLAAWSTDYRRGRSALVRGLILLGLFEAAYGIVQYLTGWQKIFTYTKKYDLEEATGTYINRNHFAGLLEMVVPFVLAAAFYSFQNWASHRYRYEEGPEAEQRSSAAYQTVFYSFLLIILFVAVICSRSRMGILVTLFTIGVVAVLAQLRARRKVWLLGVGLFLAGALGYGLWIGLGPVLTRFEAISDPTYLRLEGRISVWHDTERLIRDYPVAGTGLGTFELAFRKYQTTLVSNAVEHAHNDFLQTAAETGIPGAVLLFLPIFVLLGKLVVSYLDDPRPYRRAMTLGCIGSIMALLLHSVTDFNLHLPANALVFAVILGMGYRVLLERRERQLQPPR